MYRLEKVIVSRSFKERCFEESKDLITDTRQSIVSKESTLSFQIGK